MSSITTLTIEELERHCNAQLSFIPAKDEITWLLEVAAKAAEAARAIHANTAKAIAHRDRWDEKATTTGNSAAERVSPLLTKLNGLHPTTLHEKGLVPSSFKPDDTVLARAGQSQAEMTRKENLASSGSLSSSRRLQTLSESFRFLPDKKAPLLEGSCGPNGVLYDCNAAPYGPNRMNLFHYVPSTQTRIDATVGGKNNTKQPSSLAGITPSEASMRMMLIDFLEFRNATAIEGPLQLFASSMAGAAHTLATMPAAERPFTAQLVEDYCAVSSLFEVVSSLALAKVAQHNNSTGTMTSFNQAELLRQEFGIKCTSYCQTWLKREYASSDIGTKTSATRSIAAQFSVMSPHFQTRLSIEDSELLLHALEAGCLSSQSFVNGAEALQCYSRVIDFFMEQMASVHKYKGAFIDLDGLAGVLSIASPICV